MGKKKGAGEVTYKELKRKMAFFKKIVKLDVSNFAMMSTGHHHRSSKAFGALGLKGPWWSYAQPSLFGRIQGKGRVLLSGQPQANTHVEQQRPGLEAAVCSSEHRWGVPRARTGSRLSFLARSQTHTPHCPAGVIGAHVG